MAFRKRKADSDHFGVVQSDSDDEPVEQCGIAAVEVVGGCTFPGELARKIIAGYMNPHVIPAPSGLSVVDQEGDLASSRDPKNWCNYWPSRKQAYAVWPSEFQGTTRKRSFLRV